MGTSSNTERSNRPAAGRTVVIGLDSADLLLVQRWASQGLLPFFARLLRNGPLVRLTALSRVLQGAIWPSLLTCRTPGQHGFYAFTQLDCGTYQLDPTRSDRVTLEHFYERLGAHGVRCAIVDLPDDLPSEKINGIQVVDWGTEFKHWRFETRPAALKQEIESRYGKHLFTDYSGTGRTLSAHRKLLGQLDVAVRTKAAFTRELLEREDLDLIFSVFGEPHKAGHFFWKYMDPAHPDHVSSDAGMRDALLDVYRLVDSELARLAERVRPEDNLIVFADHGMQANYRGEHFLEQILVRLGLGKSAGQARLGGTRTPSAAQNAVRAVRRVLHRAIRRALPRSAGSAIRAAFGAGARIDWSRTLAFALPTDRSSYLRVNLRGREPAGIVSPGAEYDALVERIDAEFRALVNAETGEPAVEDVFKVHELYPGPRVDDLPDVVVLWRSDSPINALWSASVGRLEIEVVEARSGNHRPEGFLLASGPAFRSGRAEIRGDVMQLAPTLLALHGVPCPDEYETGPLTELLAPGVRPREPVRVS